MGATRAHHQLRGNPCGALAESDGGSFLCLPRGFDEPADGLSHALIDASSLDCGYQINRHCQSDHRMIPGRLVSFRRSPD
jgi:hypothetical protein